MCACVRVSVQKREGEIVIINVLHCMVQVFYYSPQQVPAGLFIPTMFVGACMGRVLGIAVEQLA